MEKGKKRTREENKEEIEAESSDADHSLSLGMKFHASIPLNLLKQKT